LSARDLPVGNSGVNASVVIKSPTKVLGLAALDAWENDFTRLQHDGSVVSPPNTVSYLAQSDCDEDTMAIKQEQEPSNPVPCNNIHDTPNIVTSKDNDGDDTFCFQCFNHECECLVECCVGSADISINTDCKYHRLSISKNVPPFMTFELDAQSVEALSNTSDTENEASSSGDHSSSPTCLPRYSDEFSLSQHSSEDEFSSAYNKPSQNTGCVRDTPVFREESMPSSGRKHSTSEYQEAEEDTISIAKRPAPKEYALKHQNLDDSMSSFVSIVPSNETILNLLPRLALDNDLNNIQFSNTAATWNSPRGPDDLYSPRWQRGIGPKKEGLCPLCDPTNDVSVSIRNMWLKTKTSRFW
jgi:hypothetical protein